MTKMMRKAAAATMLVLMLLNAMPAIAQAEAKQNVQTQQTQAQAKKFKGTAKVRLVNKGKLFYGDKITLKAVVKVNTDFTLQWQVKDKGEWKDIEGANDKTYSFVVTPENQKTQYRVMVLAA